MRRFNEMDPLRVGLVGITLVVLLVVGCLSIGRVQAALGGSTYTAHLEDAGGLQPGDDVRVDGVDVGTVASIRLSDEEVVVRFRASGVRLGDTSTASVKSANALGRKFLALAPSGRGQVSTIPIGRTDSGYSATVALGSLTRTTERLDVDTIARSSEALAAILDRTPREFRAALDGVSRLSRTISTRDAALGRLLDRTARVSGVLADRNTEIRSLLGNGRLLFEELRARRAVVARLFTSITLATREISGLVDDNRATLTPTLRELDRLSRFFAGYRSTLDFAVRNLSTFVTGLGEAVGSGPFFQAYIQNLTAPTTLVPLLSGLLDGGER